MTLKVTIIIIVIALLVAIAWDIRARKRIERLREAYTSGRVPDKQDFREVMVWVFRGYPRFRAEKLFEETIVAIDDNNADEAWRLISEIKSEIRRQMGISILAIILIIVFLFVIIALNK